MTLVMYHTEQDALRVYLCYRQCWADMVDVQDRTGTLTPLQWLLDWGWEVVGEL